MSRILVTGVAGFIGSKVAELLLAHGHTVTGIDDLNDAYDVRLKRWRLGQIQGSPAFKFYQLDICHGGSLREVLDSGFDAVINLAARAGVRQSVENPSVYYETNVTGTLNLLEMCKARKVKKFVLASTSSVYGNADSMPLREDQKTDRPLSPYAASKKAAELLCHTYRYLYDIDVTVFRYFTVYGPAGRPDMSLFRFVQRISEDRPVTVFGDGLQTRDFTYVDDIARGTIAGLRPLGYEVINLGSNRPIQLMETIGEIEHLVGKKATINFQPRHAADVMATWADISRARNNLHWEPSVQYERGLSKLVEWYFQNRTWAKEINTD